jgi:hypothetical protein
MSKPNLQLSISHKDGEHDLYLHAQNMNELVRKIIDWTTMSEEEVKIYQKKGELDYELSCGWYYNNEHNTK